MNFLHDFPSTWAVITQPVVAAAATYSKQEATKTSAAHLPQEQSRVASFSADNSLSVGMHSFRWYFVSFLGFRRAWLAVGMVYVGLDFFGRKFFKTFLSCLLYVINFFVCFKCRFSNQILATFL